MLDQTMCIEIAYQQCYRCLDSHGISQTPGPEITILQLDIAFGMP